MGKKIDLAKKAADTKMRMHNHSRPTASQYNYDNQEPAEELDEQEDNYENEEPYYEEPEEVIEENNEATEQSNQLKQIAKEKSKEYVKTAVMKNPVVKKIILISTLVILGALLVVGFVLMILGISNSGLGIGGYYDLRCDEVTVIFVDKDNNYAPTGTQTYDLEEYVAGVVFAETGNFRDLETYKVFALAARTFVQEMADESCSIEASARRQAFKDISEINTEATQMIRQAVEETAGQVLMQNNEIISVRYDAFCACDKTGDYYTLVQQRQKIPKSWADQRASGYTKIPDDLTCDNFNNKDHDCVMGHGSGMSQYGVLYLSTEEGYTYDEIINFYYGDEVTIGTPYITSIAGLDIKDTRKAKDVIQTPITEYLNSKGSSLEHMNTFIKDSVNAIGPGTREAVVVAGVSMINFLHDNFNAKLPYDWGGSYNGYGIPSSFGHYSPSAEIRGTNGVRTYYNSFDCSGFVSWAIRNGGYKFSRYTTVDFYNAFAKDSCSISSSSCVGQPGDLINSRNSHVELIIGVNEEKGTYFVAQSTGSGVVMNERGMHTGNGADTRILFMESFYNNEANVDQNYPQ